MLRARRLIGKRRWLLGAIVAAAVPTGPATAAEPHVASCEVGPIQAGSGRADWRRSSLDAGPLGLPATPLGDMAVYSRREPNQLFTKAPVLIEGHSTVTLSVPPRLAHRVFLYYGFHEDREGGRTVSPIGFPGSSAVEFRPCTDKPRTVWPGGIRVKGRKPVILTVTVEGRPDPIQMHLGRPRLYRPPTG